MPLTTPRPCAAPGCPELVERGYCRVHRRAIDARRGSPSARGYDRTWQRLRKLKLAANPFCEIGTRCANLPITRRLATEVDHILPIRDRPDLRLAWSNLQSACRPCHSAKTKAELQKAGLA